MKKLGTLPTELKYNILYKVSMVNKVMNQTVDI